MADDRPALDPTQQLAELQRQFDDLKSTVLARASRLPTGSMIATLLATAPPDTVFAQGQTLQKTAYPVLWQWASDNTPGGFTVTASTLVLPDLRDRVLIGSGAVALGVAAGANSITLTTGQLPAHDHGSAGSHSHGGQTTHDYGHTGHFPGSSVQVPQGTYYGVADWQSPGNYNVPHTHDIGTDTQGLHTHGSVGSGAAIDNRQASLAVNWLIYT